MNGKRILLIVGGGIAAFKALELTRALRKAGASVTPVLTASGAQFVTPLSLAALAAAPVHSELFDLDQTAGYVVVVIGVPDASKGEALVLLTTLDFTSDVIREKLLASGMPGLWVPKLVRRVEKIPVLGTGKLDLKGCRELALPR